MNLSTRQLRAFLALAEQRNFTRAANNVHLSQPAFSALIRSLEESVQARLFDRDTRKVELTAAGRRFERAAREVIAHFDDVMGAAVRELGSVGRVAVAGMPSLCARFLPVVVAEYRTRSPAVDTEILDALPNACLELVRQGKADLALTSMDPGEADVQAELLCTDRFYAVCRADHPLAARPAVPLDALVGLPFIHFTRSTRLREQIDEGMRPHKIHAVLEVERLEAVKGLVESGVGVSVVPGLTLFHFRSPEIAILPLDGPGITRSVFAVTAAGRSLSAAAGAFLALVKERMAAVLAPGGLQLDPAALATLVPLLADPDD